MSTATASMKECIKNCQATCADTLTNHSLSEGDAHVEQPYVKLMLDCIAACTACADFISRNSNRQAPLLQSLRRDLQSVCRQLRESRQHGRVRRLQPRLPRKLRDDGFLVV